MISIKAVLAATAVVAILAASLEPAIAQQRIPQQRVAQTQYRIWQAPRVFGQGYYAGYQSVPVFVGIGF